jgi:hypothetical protein
MKKMPVSMGGYELLTLEEVIAREKECIRFGLRPRNQRKSFQNKIEYDPAKETCSPGYRCISDADIRNFMTRNSIK